MGSFTIYSIGDSAFLEQIIIAVAMITGSGDFSQVVSIGLLLGVILIFFQSIFQGAQRIDLGKIFVCWIIFLVFFGPRTTVLIEDAYTGQVRVVSNAPIGVGFVGGVVSNLGYKLTRLFETGYGSISPGITSNEFADSLQMLNEVRHKNGNALVFQAMDEAAGGGNIDIRTSWHNYLRECTLLKIDLRENGFSADDLITRDWRSAFKFESNIYTTLMYVDGSQEGKTLTCSEAWDHLEGLTDLTSYQVVNALNSLYDINPAYGSNAIIKAQDSIQMLAGISADAMEYMKVSMLEPIVYESIAGRYQDVHDNSSAVMLNQALQQRNVQWSAQQSMFMSVVRPLLTFFEGFIYAITPICAFAIVLGGFGIGLSVKYLQVVLWIQIWMPVLSIINLYIHTAASNKLASMNLPAFDSIYAITTTSEVMQIWLSTGGMLAASTPMIALFIVTGSTYAFANIAGKLSGSDHLNERISSPDAVQPAAFMQPKAHYSSSPFEGTSATGSEAVMSNLTLGNSFSSAVSSAKSQEQMASQQFGSTLGRSITEGASAGETVSRAQQLGSTVMAGNSQQAQKINTAAQEFMSTHGIDESHSEQVTNALAAAAGASVKTQDSILGSIVSKFTGGSVEAGVKGTSTDAARDAKQWTTADTNAFRDSLQFSEQDSADLRTQLAEGVTAGSSESYGQTWSDAASSSLSQSASETVQAREAYNELQQLQQSAGSNLSSGVDKLGAQISGNPQAMEYLKSSFTHATSDQKEQASQLTDLFASEVYGFSPEKAQAAAMMTALMNPGENEDGQGQRGLGIAVTAANMALGRDDSIPGGPSRPEFADNAPQADGSLGQRAAAELSAPSTPTGESVGAVVGQEMSAPLSIAEPQGFGDQARAEHQENHAAVNNSSIGSNMQQESLDRAEHNLVNNTPSPSVGARLWDAMDDTGGWVQGMWAGGESTSSPAFQAEVGTLQESHGLTESQATVLASYMNPMHEGSQDLYQEGLAGMRLDLAERDDSGNVLLDNQGRPALSEENVEVFNAQTDALINAANNGENPGAMLTNLQAYNDAREQF